MKDKLNTCAAEPDVIVEKFNYLRDNKFIDKIRKFLVRKLLHPEDGYTFTGFSEREPIKFYYQEDTKKYLIGMRSDNWYYFEPDLSGWSSYASKYLPWGETIKNCVFDPITKQMKLHLNQIFLL